MMVVDAPAENYGLWVDSVPHVRRGALRVSSCKTDDVRCLEAVWIFLGGDSWLRRTRLETESAMERSTSIRGG